jgi:Zn-dependent peptidase ImmA (M78 family)/transcriptional regulator with XRE-family HTH domain
MAVSEQAVRPELVVLARESRGLTQSELAHKVSISPGMMSRIESGVRGVSNELLRALSAALDYPQDFFSQPDAIIGFGVSQLFHRRRQVLSNRTLHKVHADINIRRMHIARMLRGVEIGDTNVPSWDLDDFEGRAQDVARAVRAIWHLPPGPVQNMTTTVESAGGLVVPFDFGTRHIDAIGQWPPGIPPLIFVNVTAPGDRLRLTLAHELAHLVMHQKNPNSEMEHQAYEFAAEFLMPEREIRPYLSDLSLAKLATLKPYWRVSMAALLKRATDLGEITHRQARTLWMRMGEAGYRTREPAELDIAVEPASLYQQLVDAYRYEKAYAASEFARMLNLFDHEAESMYLGTHPHLKVIS